MNRYTVFSFSAIVLLAVGFSIAASQNSGRPTGSPLEGKAVIIQIEGVHFGVKEDVRFESIGQLDYIVVPMRHDETGASYEHWLRLDKVYGLKVFDSKEDAMAYDKKTSPFR